MNLLELVSEINARLSDRYYFSYMGQEVAYVFAQKRRGIELVSGTFLFEREIDMTQLTLEVDFDA